MLLAECKYVDSKSGERHHFEFYGEFEISDEKNTWLPIEFSNLAIADMDVANGKKVPFELEGTTWSGSKIDEEYALKDIISRYSRNEKGEFEILYLQEEIKALLDECRSNVALTVEDREIPAKVIYGQMMYIYELDFVTNEYAYYVYEGEVYLMLNTSDGTVVSDNYFAEVGYRESRKAVWSGKDTKLFDAYAENEAEYAAEFEAEREEES